jgi:hypothetical protein
MPEHASHLAIRAHHRAYLGRVGEHNASFLVRAGGAVAVSVAAVVALSSCSLVQVARSATATPAPAVTEVLDPPMPSSPSATGSAAPAPTPTSTHSPVPTSAPVPPGKKKVTPVITGALWDHRSGVLDVEAYVPGLVEVDGTCTVTTTGAGHTATATATASPGAKDMECNPVDLTAGQLTSGTWTITVTYVSTRSAGVSAPRTVTVTK